MYFDDLRIVHENSTTSFKVSQVNEYYPYGMQTDKSWRAEGYVDPGLLYQSAYASYDSLTGYYDFLFRSYDPALGRFFATDPLASATPSYSPYHVNANNPIMYTDPLGLSPRDTRFKDFGENRDQEKGDYNDWDFGLGGGMNSPFGTMNMELSQSNYGTLMPLWQQQQVRNQMFTSAWNNSFSGAEALEIGIAYNNYHNSWGNDGIAESAEVARINYDFSGGIDWQYAVAFEDTGITDPADITKAAQNALDYVNAFYEKAEAACNIGVQCAFEELTGRPDFGGMRANDIVKYLSESDNGEWSGIAMSNVQQVVNNGGIVIAGTMNPDGMGHVVLLVPGTEFKSGPNYWNGLVPVAMDTGPNKKWVSKGISSSWGKGSKNDVRFFRFIGK